MIPAGVILAGGRGERMGGVDKALLQVGGRRLIDRVVGALGDCTPLLLAHGPKRQPPDYGIARLTTVADLPGDYGGPLAGVTAAVEWLEAAGHDSQLLVVAAVDAPFLPADYVARLLEGLGDAPCALASYAGQAYPTNSIWRLEALRQLPDDVRDGTAPHSLKRLAAMLGGVTVEWPTDARGDPFASANTPEELAELARRADHPVRR